MTPASRLAMSPRLDQVTPPVRAVGPTARILLVLIAGYRRLISPFLPPSCRFYPSCSRYAVIAIQRHGAARGAWLAVCRIARCHPWNPGGYDPVPPAGELVADRSVVPDEGVFSCRTH